MKYDPMFALRVAIYDLDRKKDPVIVKVKQDSPLALRKLVREFAWNFKKELQYDFTQYSVNDKDDYTAYLICTKHKIPKLIVGALCLRRRQEPWIWKGKPYIGLQWVWIHPLFRKDGLFSEVWRELMRLYPKRFLVEWPWSDAMKNFLQKKGYKLPTIKGAKHVSKTY